MGRWYRTANPQFLDYMYELPKEAMMKAVETADAQIAKQDEANQALKGLLKLDAIDKDKPYANQLLTGYETEIEEIAKDIQKDPLAYRRSNPRISDLKTRINTDFTRGEAFNIQSNYDTRKSNYEAMKEAFKKDPSKFNYGDVEKLQSILDTQYEGFQKGGYDVDRLREFVDIKEFDKYGDKYEAEVIEKLGAFKGQDGYLYTSKDKTETVDPSLIKKHLVDILMSDQKLNDYYRQQIQLGNITEDQYYNLLAETADRIGDKYGYSKTSKGLTSIKGDPKDAAIAGAREKWKLENPIANTTPGTIYDVPILDKYAKVNANGQIEDNNTLSGIDDALSTIGTQTRKAQFGITKLAQDNEIILSDEMAEEIQKGNFSVLKGVEGADGKTIDPNIIFQYQAEYDSFKFDEKLLTKKRELASQMQNPDQYLQEQKSKPSIIKNVNDYQTYGIVDEDQVVNFQKNIKEWRAELDKSKGYWDAPLQYDLNDLQTLPSSLRQSLQNGTSINQLIANGTIKVKQGSRKTTGPVTTTLPNGQTITNQGDITQNYSTSDYENFKVNGQFAKPATQLDGEGNVLVQFELEIDGHPVNVYMDESNLSNKTIKGYMDLDAMKAGHQFMEAKNEGVIDEQGFMIEGINFRKANGKDVADGPYGTITVSDAVKMIAAKRKMERQQLLQQ